MTAAKMIKYIAHGSMGEIHPDYWTAFLDLAAASGLDVAAYRMTRKILRLSAAETARLADAIDAGAQALELGEDVVAWLAHYVTWLRKGALALHKGELPVETIDPELLEAAKGDILMAIALRASRTAVGAKR